MYDTVLQHHLILKSWESLKARSHYMVLLVMVVLVGRPNRTNISLRTDAAVVNWPRLSTISPPTVNPKLMAESIFLLVSGPLSISYGGVRINSVT